MRFRWAFWDGTQGWVAPQTTATLGYQAFGTPPDMAAGWHELVFECIVNSDGNVAVAQTFPSLWFLVTTSPAAKAVVTPASVKPGGTLTVADGGGCGTDAKYDGVQVGFGTTLTGFVQKVTPAADGHWATVSGVVPSTTPVGSVVTVDVTCLPTTPVAVDQPKFGYYYQQVTVPVVAA